MYIALSTIFGMIMTFSGYGKVTKNPMAIKAAEALKYTNIMMLIGGAEMLGGIVAVTGNYFSFIPAFLQRSAIFGLVVVMAGAVMFHLKAGDKKGSLIPLVLGAIGVLALSITG
ncbi:MAG: DoxX-like family [Actinomycetota bacterium]